MSHAQIRNDMSNKRKEARLKQSVMSKRRKTRKTGLNGDCLSSRAPETYRCE
jgi:hypothetical protein